MDRSVVLGNTDSEETRNEEIRHVWGTLLGGHMWFSRRPVDCICLWRHRIWWGRFVRENDGNLPTISCGSNSFLHLGPWCQCRPPNLESSRIFPYCSREQNFSGGKRLGILDGASGAQHQGIRKFKDHEVIAQQNLSILTALLERTESFHIVTPRWQHKRSRGKRQEGIRLDQANQRISEPVTAATVSNDQVLGALQFFWRRHWVLFRCRFLGRKEPY